jgi:hypothetical protein
MTPPPHRRLNRRTATRPLPSRVATRASQDASFHSDRLAEASMKVDRHWADPIGPRLRALGAHTQASTGNCRSCAALIPGLGLPPQGKGQTRESKLKNPESHTPRSRQSIIGNRLSALFPHLTQLIRCRSNASRHRTPLPPSGLTRHAMTETKDPVEPRRKAPSGFLSWKKPNRYLIELPCTYPSHLVKGPKPAVPRFL